VQDVLIFSHRNNSWGSFYYDLSEDALRVSVKHQALEKSEEWLKYEFMNQTESTATVCLLWEKRMIPFIVEANVHQLQLTSFKSELKTKPGFTWQAFVQAATYCVDNNIELEQALIWSNDAITARFVGQENFQTLSTKARVLSKLNRNEEAKQNMDEALKMGSIIELHQYARTLLDEGKKEEALKVFQLNYKNNPDVFTTNVGLGRGYSAADDTKKAIKYFEKAVKQAPDAMSKANIENLLNSLKKKV
jgi:tetratricopeptide (TPR) repeat protein